MCFFHLLSQYGVPLLFSAKKGSGLARHVSWDENNYPLVVQPSYYWFQVGFHVFFLTRHPRWLLMNLSHDFPPKFLFGLANGRCKWEKSETINITRQDLWQHNWSESFFKEKSCQVLMNERGLKLPDQKKTNDGVFWACFFHQKFRANDFKLQISRRLRRTQVFHRFF